jgi:uncharacterized protein (UPF0305 family)
MNPFETWMQDKAKRDQQTKYTPPPIQKGDSKQDISRSTGFRWQTQTLKKLPTKTYGKKYEDKFKTSMHEIGVTDSNEIDNFKRWMNAQENTTYKHRAEQQNRQNKTNATAKNIFSDMNKTAEAKAQQMSFTHEAAKNTAPKKQPTKPNNRATLLDDLKIAGKSAYQGFNPFDNVSMGDAVKNFTNRNNSKAFNEIARGSNRTVDSASFGALSNLDKKVNNREPYYNSERKFGQGGGTDMITSGLGYLIPGTLEYKALNASKVGLGLTKLGAQSFGKRLLTEGTKGAIVGAGLSIPEVGVKEALNPQDQNWKDNLKYIGTNTALGAVADPLLYGAGKGITKGFEKSSAGVMKNLLPKNEAVAKELANTYKSFNAGPNAKPSQFALNDLLPKGNEIAKPGYAPSLKPISKVEIPTIGKNAGELPPVLNEDLSLTERAQMLDSGNRTLPDYSTAKPVIKQADNVNVYGVDVPKGGLVDSAPPEYWQKRYEDFVKHVKDSGYNENNLSHDSIQELWTHFAKADEPPLSTVVDLAYKGYKAPKPINTADVWNQMGNRPPVSKNAKDILFGTQPKKRAVPPIRNLAPELNVNRTINQPTEPLIPSVNRNIPEQPSNAVETPVNAPKPQAEVPKQPGERAFFNTVQNPEKLSPELQQRLAEFDKTYKPMSNEETVKFANAYVKNDMEKAYQFVKNAKKFDPRHITVGHRLIDELQKAGQYDRALDVVEKLAEQGTKAGQSIQSYSIYNRLSAEGQLLRAQRHINKVNESIIDPAKQIKLTEQHIQDITQTADSIKRFTGQEEQANSVMKIMENIKKGNQPNDGELDVIRSFVSDAKKFVGDLEPGAAPKPPKPIKDIRTRDKVVDFMSKQEEAARKRLRQNMNRANSLPVDMFYDLSVIGASKIAKGTIKVADFTEELAQEFGEMVRPYAKQIYNKAVETFNLQSESMTRQRLSEVEKITNKALKDKNLAVDDADSIREFARQVGLMSGDARLESSMELQSVLQALDRPTFGRQLSSAQTIAQLLNPKTIARNAIGNEIFYRTEQIMKLAWTPVDIVRSKITGNDRTIVFLANNQGRYWHNFLTGGKAGWKGVNPMGLQTAYDLGPQAFRSKWNPLTYMEKALGASLRSFDNAGYMRAYNKTLGELASLRAINEGLKGQAKKDAIALYIREADDTMIHMADQYAKYATFQDNTILSNKLTKVKKAMNFNKGFGLGDLILKYPKTPGNLVMRALEYSPAGLVRSINILKSAVKTKNPYETREFYLSLSRAITGTTGFSVLGYFLADKGILTSNGNSDYEVASLEKNAGKQPNSVNTSALGRFVASGFNPDSAVVNKGDTFVSYDWAQPVSMAVALGTGVEQSTKENGKLSLGGAAKGAFDSGTNTIMEMSVLGGLKDFLSSYPGKKPSDYLTGPLKGTAGSFVPTLSNQFRQISDNTTRSTYSPGLLPEIKNRAVNRIPGLQKSLPPSYDTLGNKKETYQNSSNNLLNVFLNPSFVSKYNPSPEAEFVLDAVNRTGDKTLAPRLAQKKLDGTPLTSKQYSTMQRIMGEEVQKGLENIVPQLSGETDEEKIRKAIEKILRDAGATAREEIRAERGE